MRITKVEIVNGDGFFCDFEKLIKSEIPNVQSIRHKVNTINDIVYTDICITLDNGDVISFKEIPVHFICKQTVINKIKKYVNSAKVNCFNQTMVKCFIGSRIITSGSLQSDTIATLVGCQGESAIIHNSIDNSFESVTGHITLDSEYIQVDPFLAAELNLWLTIRFNKQLSMQRWGRAGLEYVKKNSYEIDVHLNNIKSKKLFIEMVCEPKCIDQITISLGNWL